MEFFIGLTDIMTADALRTMLKAVLENREPDEIWIVDVVGYLTLTQRRQSMAAGTTWRRFPLYRPAHRSGDRAGRDGKDLGVTCAFISTALAARFSANLPPRQGN
jgi:hypothetical protein